MEKHFTLPETKELSDLVTEHMKENGTSPFTDIQFEEQEGGNLQVDMVKEFEAKLSEKFENLTDVLGDYFSAVIKETVAKFEELEKLEKEGTKQDEDNSLEEDENPAP